MPAYDLRTKKGRDEMRADRQAELDAIEEGEWPRDSNDQMRWHPSTSYADRPEKWAARMCQADLEYLDQKDKEEQDGPK